MKKIKSVGICVSILLSICTVMFILVLPVSAGGTNYYVSNDGSNSYNGLYPTFQGGSNGPWQTIGKVNTEMNGGVINSGDNVYFNRGDTFNDVSLSKCVDGTSMDNPTVIGAYGTGDKPIFTGRYYMFSFQNIHNVTIENLSFIDNNGHHIRISENSSHFILQYIDTSTVSDPVYAGNVRIINGCHDAIIRNCNMDYADSTGYEDVLFIGGSYNILIENNTISNARHNSITLYGYWYNDTSPHIDQSNRYGIQYENIIVRNNTIIGPRRGVDHGFLQNHSLIEDNHITILPYNSSNEILGGSEQFGGNSHIITRFNLYEGVRDSRALGLRCTTTAGVCTTPTDNISIYHNTIYSTDRLHVPSSYRYSGSPGYTNQGVIYSVIESTATHYTDRFSVFNNIVYTPHADNYLALSLYDQIGGKYTDVNVSNNLFMVGDSVNDQKIRVNGTNYDVSTLDSTNPISWASFSNNMEEVPDMNLTTFQLNGSGNAVDAGRWLSYTTDSKTSEYIHVADAQYFFPTLTIRHLTIDGDNIFVGDDQDLTIVSINYANNTLRVNRSITYISGENVSLSEYGGVAPDLGAFEILDEETPDSPSGVGYQFWNVTISDPDGDTTSGTIECSDGSSMSWSDEGNGSRSLNMTHLEYDTNYTVWLNFTDGVCSVSQVFWFVTGNIPFNVEISPNMWIGGDVSTGTYMMENFTFWQNGTTNLDITIGVNATNLTFSTYATWDGDGYDMYCGNYTVNSWASESNIVDLTYPFSNVLKTDFSPGSFTFGIRILVPKHVSTIGIHEDFEVIINYEEHT